VQQARHDRGLDRASPARAWSHVVTFDKQHVRDAARSTPRDRSLRRKRAPAGDDDDIRSRGGQGGENARRHGVVVTEQPARAGEPQPVQEDVAMFQLDGPGALSDRARCVDHGEVDLGSSGNAVEERRAIRRRLR
jgi:hypothetical protein